MTVRNATRQTVLADRESYALTFLQRTRGLLGRSGLDTGEGLVIRPCNNIHMMFMKFAIDAVFVDAGGAVVAARESLPPWRGYAIHPNAHQVVELPEGTIERTATQVGDSIVFD